VEWTCGFGEVRLQAANAQILMHVGVTVTLKKEAVVYFSVLREESLER